MTETRKDMRHLQIGLMMLMDAALACLSLVLALQIYYDMKPPETLEQIWRAMPLLACANVISFYALGLYRSLMRYASVDTMIQIGLGTMIGSGVTYLLSLLVFTAYRAENLLLMPRPIYLVQWLLMLLMVGASRFSFRIIGQAGHTGLFFRKKHARRLMVVGAGWAGAQVLRDVQTGRYGDVEAIIAVDDAPEKRNTRIGRVPVVLGTDRIAELAKQYAIDDIIIAIATPKQDLSPLIQDCIATTCRVRMYAAPQEMNGSTVGRVRDVNIADLLGRAENQLDMTEVKAFFTGKRVLVTGGGGSIGSELCRQIMGFVPAQLVIYDISENYMYDLQSELQNRYGEMIRNTLQLRVGSVRDVDTLDRVFAEVRPEIVIHAAAHKHVPLMEDAPEQAVKNNVFGTYNVADCAIRHKVKRFVMISTDKAVNPTNVMGASKRMAEIIIEALQRKQSKTQFTAVRFGNVLGSHGSVVPKFEAQIRAGGPVTLTHPDIIRYFMTIPEAASLVLQAASIAKGGELFVLDMGKPVKIKELAERMIQLYSDPALPPVEIVYTGLRPGEKLYEELLRTEENSTATSRERIFVARPEQVEWEQVEDMLDKLSRCLDTHGDMKRCMHELLPSFYEPETINGEKGNLPENVKPA
ncbi:MAG: polysaccharide biosynthesis protein [Clostridia bacterium]|nr:polysaccharide biosynthesis protein [Clostridia bacterium]